MGNAGFFINSRGTTLMVDPLLKGFDMPLLIEIPIAPKDVPHSNAVLVTHRDNDHYSIPTCRELARVSRISLDIDSRISDEERRLARFRARDWGCV